MAEYLAAMICFGFAGLALVLKAYHWDAPKRRKLILSLVAAPLTVALCWAVNVQRGPEPLSKIYSRWEQNHRKNVEVEQNEITSDNVPPAGDGFVQIESRNFSPSSPQERQRFINTKLAPGDVLRVEYSFANRGGRPVTDVLSWGALGVLDPTLNTLPRLRSVMLQTAKDGFEKFKGTGGDMGVGLFRTSDAVGKPLTEEQINDLKKGKERIFFLACGAWTDERGHPYYWSDVEWTDWPQNPSPHYNWHF